MLTPISPPKSFIGTEIWKHASQLTMPPGALNQILNPVLSICAQSVGISKSLNSVTLIFAGDHGIAKAHPVSAFPQEVTAQMVLNFLNKGAAINVIAKRRGSPLYVCDIGVANGNKTQNQLSDCFFNENIASVHKLNEFQYGTHDFSAGPAMTQHAFQIAWNAGKSCTEKLISTHNPQLFIFGDMGIGNTTSAAAIVSHCLGLSPEHCTGKGTGINEKSLALKIKLISKALSRCGNLQSYQEILQNLGGFEIVSLAAAMYTAAQNQKFVLLDGSVVTSALLPIALNEASILPWIIAGHESPEPSHALALSKLGLTPLLSLGMRLGEGSGAGFALGILQDGHALIQEMATFENAAVSDKKSDEA